MKTCIFLLWFLVLLCGCLLLSAQKKDFTVPERLNTYGKKTKQQTEAINNALSQARTFKLGHHWDEAEDAYQLALKYDSTDLNNYLELAYYLKERNRDRVVLTLSAKLLPVYKRLAENDPFMERGAAIILQFIGQAKALKQDTAQAEKAFNEASEILNKLSAKRPQLYLLDAARAKKRLGVFYTGIGDLIKAESWLSMSLSNVSKAAVWDTASSNCEIADLNVFFGNLYFKKNDFEKAKSFYQKALQIDDTCSIDPFFSYADNIAVANKGLAKTYLRLNDTLTAEKYYKEVVTFYEKRFRLNPESYIDKVTSSLEELIGLYNNKVSQANFYLTEKLFNYNLLYYKIYHLEEDYVSSIADLYSDFGNACMETNQFNKADGIYLQALQLYRKRSQYEDDYKTKLVIVLSNLGLVHDSLKDYRNAELYRLEALNLCETVYKESADMEAGICLFTQRDLIGLYLTLMDSVKSDSTFLKFKQRTAFLYNQMQTKCTTPNSNIWWEPCTAEVCGSLSYYLLFLKRFPEAALAARWSIEKDSSQTWVKCNLAHALLFQGDYENAEKIYLELKTSSEVKGFDPVETILRDFNELEKNGITNGDVVKIKKLLKK